jgi:uncharacterized spore protein YtfJ
MTNLTLKLAETFKSAGVKAVYGEPTDVEGVTIIPVAVVYYGFGGGSAGSHEAGGGGGGGISIPIGAYYSDETGMRFRPNTVMLLAVGIPFVCVAGRAVSKVIRALKR